MKYTIYILAFVVGAVFITNTASAQQRGVSINATGAAADTSAILDVSSTTKGMLVPRMDSAHRVTISNPAIGLLVYQTNGITPGFYNYDGSVWQKTGATVHPHEQIFTTPNPNPFTASYFTTSANIATSTVFKITVLGAGGIGGAALLNPPTAGAGGGAGGSIVYWTSGLTPNTSYLIYVGYGGAVPLSATIYGAGDANSGTSAVYLPRVTLFAYAGGPANNSYPGQGGSTSTTGTVTGSILSNNGSNGSPVAFGATIGGNGGSSFFGSGGVGGGGVAIVGAGNGVNGSGGGGGVAGVNSGFGGNSGNGFIMFEWNE